MEQKRTIERLWRDAVAAGRTTPAYLSRTATSGGRSPGRRRPSASRATPTGCSSLGVRKGDAFAILGSSRVEWALFDFALGSVGAIGAAIYANSSPKDAGYILAHSESIGVLCEDETQRAKVESVRGDAPERCATCSRTPISTTSPPGGAPTRPSTRTRSARPAERDRGERPLHLHLHVRDDRAAQGLHDLAPQLLRDGRGRRRPAQLHRARRHDAPLPPARAQLRPADAPLRRLRRLRDRVPARPAPGRRGAAGGEADRLPERAARLREDPHRGRGEVRRRDRREAEADRLGARRRPPGQRPAPRREAGAARACWCSTGSPTGSSTRR